MALCARRRGGVSVNLDNVFKIDPNAGQTCSEGLVSKHLDRPYRGGRQPAFSVRHRAAGLASRQALSLVKARNAASAFASSERKGEQARAEHHQTDRCQCQEAVGDKVTIAHETPTIAP